MWDLVGNPEDRFSQNEAQMIRAVNAVGCLYYLQPTVLGEHGGLVVERLTPESGVRHLPPPCFVLE